MGTWKTAGSLGGAVGSGVCGREGRSVPRDGEERRRRVQRQGALDAAPLQQGTDGGPASGQPPIAVDDVFPSGYGRQREAGGICRRSCALLARRRKEVPQTRGRPGRGLGRRLVAIPADNWGKPGDPAGFVIAARLRRSAVLGLGRRVVSTASSSGSAPDRSMAQSNRRHAPHDADPHVLVNNAYGITSAGSDGAGGFVASLQRGRRQWRPSGRT
jgi:hypothetical protein